MKCGIRQSPVRRFHPKSGSVTAVGVAVHALPTQASRWPVSSSVRCSTVGITIQTPTRPPSTPIDRPAIVARVVTRSEGQRTSPAMTTTTPFSNEAVPRPIAEEDGLVEEVGIVEVAVYPARGLNGNAHKLQHSGAGLQQGAKAELHQQVGHYRVLVGALAQQHDWLQLIAPSFPGTGRVPLRCSTSRGRILMTTRKQRIIAELVALTSNDETQLKAQTRMRSTSLAASRAEGLVAE